jgi:hypothetical protein
VADLVSCIFFPLRTNSFYLDDPGAADRLLRSVKQACVLFEKVIFEDGVVSITEHSDGPLLRTGPSGSPRARQKAPGKIRAEWIGKDPPTGQEIGGGGFLRYDDLLEQSGLADQEFVELSYLPLSASEHYEVASEALLSLVRLPGIGVLDQLRMRNLFHDLQVSSYYANVIPMDHAHEALLDRILVANAANYRFDAMSTAMSLLVPDLGTLDWPEVIELRKMRRLVALRSKISEIQSEAFKRSHRNRASLKEEVQRTVTTVLLESISELRPTAPKVLLKTAVSFVPVAGEVIAAGADAVEVVKDYMSWYAVVLRMREAIS